MNFGAIFTVITLGVIALIHYYWAAGGRLGAAAALPEKNGIPLFTPTPLGTAMVATAIAAAAVLVAVRAHLLTFEPAFPVSMVGTWLLALVFLARAIGDFHYVGLFKKNRNGKFSRLDTCLYSPLCCVLAALIALIASQD